VEDVAAGIEYLRDLKTVDADRIGVVGFSFGGMITLQSIIHRPDLFAASVVFSAPANAVTMYKDQPALRRVITLLMGGTPEQKPEAYAAASPVNSVERMRAPLLILHGDADEVVPVGQSLELAEALKLKQKRYELVTYAGDNHAPRNSFPDAIQHAMRFLSVRLSGGTRRGR
jgi:dipeptidyl aminopeptidase/acylaminoacyl peptidase